MKADGTYAGWLHSCLTAGIPAITTDTCARILAIVYVFGGENEMVVMSSKCRADLEYIQRRFRIEGGETPDPSITGLIRQYSAELEEAGQPPQWAVDLFADRYGIKLYA